MAGAFMGKKILDLIGRRFGRLIVIKQISKNKSGNVKWVCKCDCGNKKETVGSYLTTGQTKSCGCLRKDISKNNKGNCKRPFEALYNMLVYRSKQRNVEITITYEDFLEFTKTIECHYCRDIIEWSEFMSVKNIPQSLCYNLDRKDNSIGYIKENCVVCCKICNRAKNSMSYEDFLEWIKRIVNKWSDRNGEFYVAT
jgi:hypothetical protein